MSFDSVEANLQFAKRFRFPFRLLSDADRSIAIAYGAASRASDEYAQRIAYVIDENGVIAEAHAKVDPKTYPREQLERL